LRKKFQELIVASIKFDSVLALEVSLIDSFSNVFQIQPRVYVFHYFLNGKLQLNMAFFFEAFPAFPVLEPFSKEVHFVRVTVLAVSFTERSHHHDRDNVLIVGK
jgi:hypothetical protein